MFQRERWHALRTTTGLLKWNSSNSPRKGPGKTGLPDGDRVPGESVAGHLRPDPGFELLEKVELVQERNTQLMRNYTVYPEPIITASLKERPSCRAESGGFGRDPA